ncbi:MAG: hypothetical protein PHV02_09370, partial [Rhodocyclaceae bacterium]|nr:hypothetical protein [Rhodocyclaceae bacterium]
LTKNVKRYITRLFQQTDWTDAGQGWEGQNGELALTGWRSKRRVVVLRRAIKGEMALAAQDDSGQQVLAFIEADRKAGKEITGYEYAVLVTNTDYELLSLGQLYRDRGLGRSGTENLVRRLSSLMFWFYS